MIHGRKKTGEGKIKGQNSLLELVGGTLGTKDESKGALTLRVQGVSTRNFYYRYKCLVGVALLARE